MTEPMPAPTAGQTKITARVITADPVPVKVATDRVLRSLAQHPGGVDLLWAAGIISGVGLAPLVLDRLHYDPARSGAAVARTVAPTWLVDGVPVLWSSGLAMLAWVTALLAVCVALIRVRVPDVVVLVLSGVLAVTTAFAAWSTIDVVNSKTWWQLPACVLCVLAFLAAARGVLRWRRSGVGFGPGGPVGQTLWSWVLVGAVLVGGSAIVRAVEEHQLQEASSSSAASADAAVPATLAGLHAQSVSALPGLRGRWVAQVASAKITDDTAAAAYAKSHQQLAARFPVVLLRGGDFPSTSMGPEDWLTVIDQGFTSQAAAQGWCTAKHLGPDNCLPRLIPAG